MTALRRQGKLADKGFWTSDEGIIVRLEDLAEDFAFRIYNGAIKGAFKEAGFRELIWVADYTKATKPCDYCDSQNGRRYHTGMFLPRIPAHPHCNCGWDLYFAG